MLGRREEAIREYRLITALKPESGVAWVNLGAHLEKLGQNTAARACYDKALASHSDNKTELDRGGAFLSGPWLAGSSSDELRRGHRVGAERRKLASRSWPKIFESGALLRSRAATRRGGASGNLNRRRHITPYGLAFGQQGNTIEAEEQFREALRIRPDLLETRVNLGDCVDE